MKLTLRKTSWPVWRPALAVAVLLASTATAPAAYRYRLDPAGSQVSARVAYFGVGHKTVRFPQMRGSLRLVPAQPEAIDLDVEMDARALTAGGKTDTDYLKGKAFFDVANHPVVRFSGDRMAMTGETTAQVQGRITARGVTRPAVLAVTFAQPPARASGREPIGLTATTTIDRRDFGMTSYGLVVGRKVNITIRARLMPD